MRKRLFLAAFAGMIVANAGATDVNPYLATNVNYATVSVASDLNISSKNWSFDDVLSAKTEDLTPDNHHKRKANTDTTLNSNYSVDFLVFQQLGSPSH